MKTLRRLACLVLAAFLLLRAWPMAEAEKSFFADVPAGEWYEAAVRSLTGRGIMGSREDGLFHPLEPVTRAEFLQSLAMSSGRGTGLDTQLLGKFTDVSEDSWYARYVSWALQEKLVTGMTEDSFSPDSAVTRQQMAVMLYRFNKNVMGRRLPQVEEVAFSDSGALDDWGRKEAVAVSGAGLMSGYEDGSFRPEKETTRAETAQILYTYLDAYEDYEWGCATDQLRYIMHGGGDVEGQYPACNSLESVTEAVRRGNLALEIDFSWTTDGKLVCLHQWGGKYPEQMTRDEFMAQKLFGVLTPMDLDTLAAFMRATPHVRVIPDIKTRNAEGLRLISAACPDLLDRFLPYVMHRQDYQPIRQMGFHNVIMTTYQMDTAEKWEVEANVEFARQNDFIALAVPYYEHHFAQLYLEEAKKAGLPVLLFTIDSAQRMEEYADMEFDGFFTNHQALKIARFKQSSF